MDVVPCAYILMTGTKRTTKGSFSCAVARFINGANFYIVIGANISKRKGKTVWRST